MNTVDQGLEFIRDFQSDTVGLYLDTFHMNIEEKSIPGAIRKCADRLFGFHACANDRGTPGEDHLDWIGIKHALKDVDYKGALVIESFTPDCKVIARAASM
jgi:D-psicose/D-tagatose/L-ribulose 3-epimerase